MQRRFIGLIRQAVNLGQLHLPWGLRSALGLVLLVAGVFGFLPILGFWMVPVGLVLIALDIPPLQRWLRQWLDRRHQERKRRTK
jgi:hypothetical protein